MDSWWSYGEHSGQFGNGFDSAYFECPFCDTRGNFSTEYTKQKTSGSNERKRLNYEVLKCGNCGNFTMVFWSANSTNSIGHSARNIYNYRSVPFKLGALVGSPNWPPAVRRHWIQAKENLSRNNIDAATVMARSTLQSAIRGRLEPIETDPPSNQKTFVNLHDDINRLHGEGTIPKILHDWSHELRVFARDAAHPESDDEELPEEDLQDLMQFIDFLLEYLYDVPARIEVYRGRRDPERNADGE